MEFLRKEWKALLVSAAVFIACFFFPVRLLHDSNRFVNALWESFHLVRWYAREHVLLCLVPAFFIAGAIAVFISQGSVMRYLGARANKAVAYGVASISGSVLAVCSCTVLPLFAGIYKRGAGLGPATAFLYAGPAINVLAIVLTTRVLGVELGAARAVGAVLFSIVIGLIMHLIFRREELEKAAAQVMMPETRPRRPLAQNAGYLALMVAFLVFANWGRPVEARGAWHTIFALKWLLAGASAALLILMLFTTKIGKDEMDEWLGATWGFAKQILPLLLVGVFIAGALLGRPGREGLIPASWISAAVGGNSIGANLFASIAGAFMYFATLTEVPILQGLLGSGMGKGPALALLLAGPALSLPNMLVIRSVMGTRKTLVFVSLVVLMAAATGLLYGSLF
jgi:uncharacterized membrane protein YraQ (UPF0718 family)